MSTDPTPAPLGTRFDRIETEVRRDYLAPSRPVRVMHIFYQADGRAQKCAGMHYCRECNKAEGLV